MGYLEANKAYYERGYEAENVDHPVFRFYGRILKPDFGIDGSGGERVLDFGCGQGAAVSYFAGKGFDAYGVDISEKDLARARERYPDIAQRFARIDPKPTSYDEWYGGGFDVIVTIQTLDLLSDDDMEQRLRSLHAQLRPGGAFYATMMGTRSYFYDQSRPAGDGLRKVQVSNSRYSVSDLYVNFTESEDDLLRKLHAFEPVHVGFYSQRFRSDEGAQFHFAFAGRKRN